MSNSVIKMSNHPKSFSVSKTPLNTGKTFPTRSVFLISHVSTIPFSHIDYKRSLQFPSYRPFSRNNILLSSIIVFLFFVCLVYSGRPNKIPETEIGPTSPLTNVPKPVLIWLPSHSLILIPLFKIPSLFPKSFYLLFSINLKNRQNFSRTKGLFNLHPYSFCLNFYWRYRIRTRQPS